VLEHSSYLPFRPEDGVNRRFRQGPDALPSLVLRLKQTMQPGSLIFAVQVIVRAVDELLAAKGEVAWSLW
jgi:hypothetical protein